MKSIAAKKFVMPEALSSSATISGLNNAEVNAKLASEGVNELPRPDQRTTLRMILEVLREPMLALLLGGGVFYFFCAEI